MYAPGPWQIIDHTAGIASKNADTDWLATDIAAGKAGRAFRCQVQIATSRVVKIVDDLDNALALNGGVALPAATLFLFDFLAGADRTYNFQNVAGASVITSLLIWEIEGSAL